MPTTYPQYQPKSPPPHRRSNTKENLQTPARPRETSLPLTNHRLGTGHSSPSTTAEESRQPATTPEAHKCTPSAAYQHHSHPPKRAVVVAMRAGQTVKSRPIGNHQSRRKTPRGRSGQRADSRFPLLPLTHHSEKTAALAPSSRESVTKATGCQAPIGFATLTQQRPWSSQYGKPPAMAAMGTPRDRSSSV